MNFLAFHSWSPSDCWTSTPYNQFLRKKKRRGTCQLNKLFQRSHPAVCHILLIRRACILTSFEQVRLRNISLAGYLPSAILSHKERNKNVEVMLVVRSYCYIYVTFQCHLRLLFGVKSPKVKEKRCNFIH